MSPWFWIVLYFIVGLVIAIIGAIIDFMNVGGTYNDIEGFIEHTLDELFGEFIFMWLLWPICFVVLAFMYGLKAVLAGVFTLVSKIKTGGNDE